MRFRLGDRGFQLVLVAVGLVVALTLFLVQEKIKRDEKISDALGILQRDIRGLEHHVETFWKSEQELEIKRFGGCDFLDTLEKNAPFRGCKQWGEF